jgi:sugar O-acyltransferase (sialic acid O-acetyltransferase NeuD family)
MVFSSRPREVVIVGAGGFGREIADWCTRASYSHTPHVLTHPPINLKVKGFIDNNADKLPKKINGITVLGTDDWVFSQKQKPNLVLGIGHPHIKRKIFEKFQGKAIFPNVIDTDCLSGSMVNIPIDSGIIITPGNVLTCNISIGMFTLINLHCTVGHDCEIGDFATLSPGVNMSGYTKVGEGSYLGTGCSTLEGVSIGKWSVVGGNAFVNKNLPDNITAVGIPAKVIKDREEGWHL